MAELNIKASPSTVLTQYCPPSYDQTQLHLPTLFSGILFRRRSSWWRKLRSLLLGSLLPPWNRFHGKQFTKFSREGIRGLHGNNVFGAPRIFLPPPQNSFHPRGWIFSAAVGKMSFHLTSSPRRTGDGIDGCRELVAIKKFREIPHRGNSNPVPLEETDEAICYL